MKPVVNDEVLNRYEIFLGLSAEDKRMLEALFQFLEVGPRECIIEEGVPSDGLYVICKGKMRVQRKCELHHEFVPLLDLEVGDMVGEFSILKPIPATATVVALEDSIVGRILREDFLTIINRETPMSLRILRTVAEHLVDKLIRTSEIIRQWHDVSRCLCMDDSFRELYRTWQYDK